MSFPRCHVVDFETQPIEPRPAYPPHPVGVSLWRADEERPHYYAWAHASRNNCSYDEAFEALRDVWADAATPVLFWNARFDLAVAEEKLGLAPLPWHNTHDAMVLAFLNNPHSSHLGLKETAREVLGIEPRARDKLHRWLIENQPVPHVRIKASNAAAYTSFAPGDLAGEYANEDTTLTLQLFARLYHLVITQAGMTEPYERELRLSAPVLSMERTGFRVHERLEKDVKSYDRWFTRVDDWLRQRLNAPQLDVGSGVQLVRALLSAGVAEEKDFGVTPKGRMKSDQATIRAAVRDAQLATMLVYRARLQTFLGTFMRPWLRCAHADVRGRVYSSWANVRGMDGNAAGARTGRLSSSPNFQNIPKRAAAVALWRNESHQPLPESPIAKLPPLPNVRSYVAPLRNTHVLIDRDYNQQEIRILAHFEEDILLGTYNEDPWLDVHDFAQGLIRDLTGILWPREIVKTVGFGLLYGMGVGKLALQTKLTVPEAKGLKDSYLARFPGIKDLYRMMRERSITNRPIKTIGGRLYYCEPPRRINGILKTFDYKLVNILIQGSAADITKEAMIRYHESCAANEYLLLTAHDELLASVPKRQLHGGMARMRAAMEYPALDVPLLSEGKWSAHSWGALQTYDKKGVRV